MRAQFLFLTAVSLTACAAQGASSDEPVAEATSALTSGADLVETSVSDPPPTLRLGDTFVIADTAQNNGTGASAASSTAFYLSTTNTAPFNNVLKLSAKRAVPSLAIDANSAGTTSETLQGGLADGTYYVVACADYGNAVPETIETNNCIASSTSVQVSSPDLVEMSISNPPAAISLLQPFPVTDTVENDGTGAAGPSQTAYYLSTTATPPYNKVLRFATLRSVGSLLATGSTNTGTATLSIPNTATQSVQALYASGSFYVLACADYPNVVTESNENNNCVASSTTMQVNSPDLVETGATEPPADLVLGVTFSVTDTVTNSGAATSGASTNVFYLSTNNTYPYKYVLRFPTQRSVPALNVGDSSNATTSLYAPAGYSDVAAYFGTFYFVACADYSGVVAESNETNNCHVSSGTVFVHGPDLVPSAVSMSPTSVDASGSLTFGDTISNLNSTAALASEVGYVLSNDNVRSIDDGILSPCSSTGGSYSTRGVPSLAGGAINTGPKTITGLCIDDGTSVHIPAPGTYYVFVCADIYQTVFETAERNNCALVASQLTIGSSCGNGVLEAGEQCDDGNNTNGDGCSASCQTQTLTSVTVTPAGTTVHKGLTQQYTATAGYSDGWSNDVSATATWSTGAATTATISPSGLLKAIDIGSTAVNATYNSTIGSTTVTVDAAVVVDFSITPPLPSIAKLTQQQFDAIAIYSDATTQVVTSAATWSASDPLIATIGTSTGLATGTGPGSATISASYTSPNGTFSDSTTLTVTNASIQSIEVTPANAIMVRNTTQQYTAIGTFNDATTQDLTTQVAWTLAAVPPSHSTTFASVSATGLVTSLNNGSVYIVAKFHAVSGQTQLTVVNATLQSIAVTPSAKTVANGFAVQFTATGTYKNGPTTTYQVDITRQVTWTSTNIGVATVTSKGLATAKGAGSATITATLGSVSGAAAFTGTNATLSSIAVSPNPVTIRKGNSQQLTATGTFSDGTTLDITTQVSWTTSAKLIARPNNTGKVKASKVGTATITATKTNVQGTDVFTVTN